MEYYVCVFKSQGDHQEAHDRRAEGRSKLGELQSCAKGRIGAAVLETIHETEHAHK